MELAEADRCRKADRPYTNSRSASLTSSAVFDVPALEQEITRLEKASGVSGFWDDQQSAQRSMRRLADLRESVENWRNPLPTMSLR